MGGTPDRRSLAIRGFEEVEAPAAAAGLCAGMAEVPEAGRLDPRRQNRAGEDRRTPPAPAVRLSARRWLDLDARDRGQNLPLDLLTVLYYKL